MAFTLGGNTGSSWVSSPLAFSWKPTPSALPGLQLARTSDLGLLSLHNNKSLYACVCAHVHTHTCTPTHIVLVLFLWRTLIQILGLGVGGATLTNTRKAALEEGTGTGWKSAEVHATHEDSEGHPEELSVEMRNKSREAGGKEILVIK